LFAERALYCFYTTQNKIKKKTFKLFEQVKYSTVQLCLFIFHRLRFFVYRQRRRGVLQKKKEEKRRKKKKKKKIEELPR